MCSTTTTGCGRPFALLDNIDPSDSAQLGAVWGEVADFLEVHAPAEEKVLHPVVLERSDPSAEQTKDAIIDHNKIRNAIASAGPLDESDKDPQEYVVRSDLVS